MSTFIARALYDFSGEPSTAELSIFADELLTVTRTDVGEGWWEGTNSKGQSGLFPAAYVERESNAPPQRPPPVLPPQMPVAPPANQQHRYDQTSEDWGEQPDPPGTEGDAWEDDWDDDTYSEIGPGQTSHQTNNQIYANTSDVHRNADDNASIMSGTAGSMGKRNTNRFGGFGKGGDSYLLGTINAPPLSETEKFRIVYLDESNPMSVQWTAITEPYSVVVASPKKESKFKGIKSFIAYQLTPSFNNIQVSRRYKHFDWLHERLVDKFCLVPIPPLPDKQISGRYEEQFIEHRRAQLQEFVDWVCRHPVLSRCDVWMHFLTCTDEKRWKAGKRAAEKDPLIGLNSCAAVFPPERSLLPSNVEKQVDACSTFVHGMDAAVKTLMATSANQVKIHQNLYKREYQRTGEAFFGLGHALSNEEGFISTSKLTAVAHQIGGAYIEVGKMFEDQPRLDWEPLSDRLHIHRGILGAFPDILNVHKAALNKKRECERMAAEKRMEPAQMTEVSRRTDIVSYALLAEVAHVRTERDSHLKEGLQRHLQEQIKFYQRIVERLQAVQEQVNG